MKRAVTKALVLLAVFFGSLTLFIQMFSQEVTVGTANMEGPTLPVCYMEVSGNTVNRMFGTKTRLEGERLRDHLTPLSTDRQLKLLIDDYDQEITSVSYEVRSIDGENVVENGKLSGFSAEEDLQAMEFSLRNPVRMDQEYLLELQLNLEGRDPVYYYTRLVQRAKINVSGYLEFVDMFYRKCLDPEKSGELSAYLESDSSGNNSNFNAVDIHSSADQVGWGDLKPELYREAVFSIKEINETTGSIQADYVITAENEEGQTEYYNVTDFYRLRYDQSKVLLLDFNRSARQRFDGDLPVLNSTGISLGIAPKDTQFVLDGNGSILSFVEEGELWSYNRSVNKITRIFSFMEDGENDERNENLSHEIKIVRVEENGDMDYVVYGYMSAGSHEGEIGAAVYHYNAQQNASLEELFLPAAQSYEYLKADLEQLSYVSKSGDLYIKLGKAIYQIDMDTGESTVVKDGIEEKCFVSSRSQQTIAWMDEMEENNSSHLTVMDLESGGTMSVEAEEGTRVKAIGFLNEDLVYGIAREEDIFTDSLGNTTFAMYKLVIQNMEGKVVKEYQEENIWVSEGILSQGLLELKRVRWENGAYVETTSDQIMNNLQQTEETISIKLAVGQRKGTVFQVDFGKTGATRNLLETYAKFFQPQRDTRMELELTRAVKPEFSVYAKGELTGFYDNLGQAINEADTAGGVVLRDQQSYVWERGNRDSRKQIDPESLPAPVLSAPLNTESLQEALGEAYTVLSLEGCSLESVLYFVSRGNPVIVKLSETESAVMVGYDPSNTILYYPALGEAKYYPSDDSRELFEENGNVFITYLENETE